MKKRIIAVLLIISVLSAFASCKAEEEPNPAQAAASVSGNSGSSEKTDAKSDTVEVTFPEGYTLVRMAWKLEENGICSADDFIEAAQTLDFSDYPLINEEPEDENICFRLEGYLFPCMIEVDKNSDTPESIIRKLLSASENYITGDMRDRAKELGLSMHEVLTVASIVEKEAYSDEQRGDIASTLYNRLDRGMQIQCDVTINYVTGVIEEIYPEKVDTLKHYYNTYRCEGLPAGPICNPGIESIKAALYAPETDYLYFAIQTEKPHEGLFASSYEDHLENCKKLGIE